MKKQGTVNPVNDQGPQIDWAALEAQFPGRPQFVNRLLEAMRTSNAGRPGELRAAAAAGDWDQLRLIAHGIRGTASHLHLIALRDLAAETETAARARDASAQSLGCALADRLGALVSFLDRRAADMEEIR